MYLNRFNMYAFLTIFLVGWLLNIGIVVLGIFSLFNPGSLVGLNGWFVEPPLIWLLISLVLVCFTPGYAKRFQRTYQQPATPSSIRLRTSTFVTREEVTNLVVAHIQQTTGKLVASSELKLALDGTGTVNSPRSYKFEGIEIEFEENENAPAPV